jgi:Cu/Zn superoxide dismutase
MVLFHIHAKQNCSSSNENEEQNSLHVIASGLQLNVESSKKHGQII